MSYLHFKEKLFTLLILFFSFASFQLSAQNNCPTDAPGGYSVEQSGANCFLTFTWPAGEMPEITCGSPGTPAPGTGAFKGKVIDLELNGATMVYENGNNCNGSNFGLAYHPTIPNTYITTGSYCTIAAAQNTLFRCNRTGGSNFNCTMQNLSPLLPVEMVSFNLKEYGTSVILNWSTASEKDNSHFEVERSLDGRDFVKVGEVMGNGSTNDLTHYDFIDRSPYAGKNYYRLIQVDFDGQGTYSNILSYKAQVATDLKVVPTSVTGGATISYASKKEGTVQFSILDAFGRTVRTHEHFAEEGTTLIEVNFDELPNGTYFVRSDNGIEQPLVARFFKIGS